MLQGEEREVPDETDCSHDLLPRGPDSPGARVLSASSL